MWGGALLNKMDFALTDKFSKAYRIDNLQFKIHNFHNYTVGGIRD